MKTILIVEDNATMRENISEILTLKGYGIISAGNGVTGLALAKEKKPDLILCDVLMPEIDGYNVFSHLKDSPDTMHIPFIFLTGSVGQKDIEHILSVGARGYISKPFDGAELCATVARIIHEAEDAALLEDATPGHEPED